MKTVLFDLDGTLLHMDIDEFVKAYVREVAGRFDTMGLKERVKVYIPITCLRGITWCAMAWVQYQDPNKAIFNESTFRKLEAYLSEEFLQRMEKDYLNIL